MLTHDFTATFQQGIVSAVDSQAHKVRCQIPALENLETAWLPFLTQNSGGNQFYCLPDVGELVAILLDARGEDGCVLGTFYNEQDPPPTSNGNLWVKKFNNGTIIQHDRHSGDLTIHTTGKVIVNNCDVIVNNGNVNVNSGDVVADGISLKHHKHQEQGDGNPTSAPL
ncbi:phage baseplate assembly protein V [Lonepinella koalarum]|uniref:phage baseplate assembly protein V n=1 Tax=Lonepinella koalarum TaxID=53417 RepID=UPI003F6E3DE4